MLQIAQCNSCIFMVGLTPLAFDRKKLFSNLILGARAKKRRGNFETGRKRNNFRSCGPSRGEWQNIDNALHCTVMLQNDKEDWTDLNIIAMVG